MKPPAFQFYPDDFLGGTITMSHDERGLYILLLCLQWSQGGVTESDFDRLGRGMAQPSLDHVRAKFKTNGDGRLKNDRLEHERQKQSEFRINRSVSGKAGAEKRWHSHSTAIAQPMAKDSSPSPSPSPSNEQGVRLTPPPAVAKVKAPRVALPITDEWFEELKPTYPHINIPIEFGKAKAWVASSPGRDLTRRFFINWLNRIAPPNTAHAHQQHHRTDPANKLGRYAGVIPKQHG